MLRSIFAADFGCLEKFSSSKYNIWRQNLVTSVRKSAKAEPCIEEITGAKHQLTGCCEGKMVSVDPLKDPCRIPSTIPKPKVVIVGAGLAGLTAAERLISLGIDNVIICEAKERPGGRIHSCRIGESVAELGAEFIEGASVANPVCNLAGVEGLLNVLPKARRSRPMSRDGLVLMGHEGCPLQAHTSNAALSYHKADKLIKKLERQAMDLFRRGHPTQCTTLAQYFDALLEQEIHYYFLEEEWKEARTIVNGVLGELKVRWGVGQLGELSAQHYGSSLETPGGRLKLPLGTTGLLAPIMRNIPQSFIKYNKPVQTIAWWPNPYGSRANITCCDGEEITADYIIMTASLGVLKSQADRLFCPQLPAEKLESIANLGYGHVEKIYLEYKRQFWVAEEEGTTIYLGRSSMDLSNADDEDVWLNGIGSIEADTKRTLALNVTGRGAALAVAARSDDELADEATALLRRATGDGSLPCPIHLLRSCWSTDISFKGARSYLGPGSSVGDQCQLASPLPNLHSPIPPVLLFAGEATAPGHLGTLQGARISGAREADRIITITHALGGPPNC